MEEAVHSPRLVRFGTFEVDLPSGELRKSGVKLKLTGQPFQVLAILLERPGEVVTREELQKRLWPDTFVDVDHNLNTAINKIREVLGDSAESPRFVETLPRRGYRFTAPVEGRGESRQLLGAGHFREGVATRRELRLRSRIVRYSVVAVLLLLVAASYFIYRKLQSPTTPQQRALTRVTFDDQACRSGQPGRPTGASSPTVLIVVANSTSGCSRSVAAIPCGSPRDQVTTGSRTGRPTVSSLRTVPKTATAACSLCPPLAVKD